MKKKKKKEAKPSPCTYPTIMILVQRWEISFINESDDHAINANKWEFDSWRLKGKWNGEKKILVR